LLGTALSIDALGAGIGAALVGFHPLLTAIVISAASGLFITAGLRIGHKCSEAGWVRRISYVPGIILILIGLIKLI
jgi:putative sporulation protein YtaF